MNSLLAELWKRLPLKKTHQLKIMRLFQDSFLIGTTGIIFNEHYQVLLFKHTYRKLPWSLPGGYLKAGEHPKEGLEREIEEESGLVISIEERLRIRTDRDEARLDICYIGFFLGGTFTSSDEVSDFGFFNLNELPLIAKDQLFQIKAAYTKVYNQTIKNQKENPQKQKNISRIFTSFRRYLSV